MSAPMTESPRPEGGLVGLEQILKEQEDGLLNCVHCGFCLPACPTYQRLGDEADSPRGRLHLMKAVVEGRLSPDASAFQTHIDRCLGCRACEPVCPSGVEYGHLLELAREVARSHVRPPLPQRLLLSVFGSKFFSSVFNFGGRMLRATGVLGMLVRRLPKGGLFGQGRTGLAMLESSRPTKLARFGSTTGGSVVGGSTGEVADAPAGRVALLVGCVQEGLFSRVNQATLRVLKANGYEIVSVRGQGCCGALHAHGGDLKTARAMAKRNIAEFEASGVDYVVVNASGCGAAMADYEALFHNDEEWRDRAARIGERVTDVSVLLARRGPVVGGPINAAVTYDAPCHLVHAQRVEEEPLAVLRSIPGLEVTKLPSANECCGGAGIYGITHPELGGWIGGDKVEDVQNTGGDATVTGNPGCMMQIGGGLRLRGDDMPVLHPVELLDESYKRGGVYKR